MVFPQQHKRFPWTRIASRCEISPHTTMMPNVVVMQYQQESSNLLHRSGDFWRTGNFLVTSSYM
ncbi:hypothetical protein HYC85_007472 [Camellia sinensis]|uniref:Uncharacterized protein n=1 Tax=Camellia sinensis TaxID=4442 RepID=A0A7J7HRD4_CAMSI|nr:hypothetical protein HYC85_007472 [Camellia sinensis]